jgi:hypothetical protein
MGKNENTSKDSCCAYCNRLLPRTSKDAVRLVTEAEEGVREIRVCYQHIMNLANKKGSILPAVPKNIERFDSKEFLSNIRNCLGNNQTQDPLINDFIKRSPISEFLKDFK